MPAPALPIGYVSSFTFCRRVPEGAITSRPRLHEPPVAGSVAVIIEVWARSGAAHSNVVRPLRAAGQPESADQSMARPPTSKAIVSQTPIVVRLSGVPSGACTVALWLIVHAGAGVAGGLPRLSATASSSCAPGARADGPGPAAAAVERSGAERRSATVVGAESSEYVTALAGRCSGGTLRARGASRRDPRSTRAAC